MAVADIKRGDIGWRRHGWSELPAGPRRRVQVDYERMGPPPGCWPRAGAGNINGIASSRQTARGIKQVAAHGTPR